MENIILLTGNVKFPLTIDPGVWIFDDRKISLDEAFEAIEEKDEDLESYVKRMSENLERELVHGVANPPVTKTAKKFEKERIMTGTFGMPLAPFIKNAEPAEIATTLIVESIDGERVEMRLSEAKKAILGFSKEGRPLKEDGPVHFYFGDGSNRHAPITSVTKFMIR